MQISGASERIDCDVVQAAQEACVQLARSLEGRTTSPGRAADSAVTQLGMGANPLTTSFMLRDLAEATVPGKR